MATPSRSLSLRATQRHEAVAGSNRAYAVVLLLVTTFILYGSLFPFEYYERMYSGGPSAYLLSTWRDWDHRGDLLSNILLYVPFGFFGTYALPARMPAWLRVLVTTVAGTALSCGVEIAQFHDVGRVTSMGDVYADAIGSGVGAVAAATIGASIRWPFIRALAAQPAATILLCMFFGYRLFPYVPMIDLHKYWHAVRPMLVSPSLPPDELARLAITWLLIAAVIQSLYGLRNVLLLFPLLCGCEFLGKVLIIDNALTLDRRGGCRGSIFAMGAMAARRSGTVRIYGARLCRHDHHPGDRLVPICRPAARFRLGSVREFHARFGWRGNAGALREIL